jgi:hypothetical protein
MIDEFQLKCQCGDDLFVECEKDSETEVRCPNCGFCGVMSWEELAEWESREK